MRLLKNGKNFGLESILYAYQENPVGGIADALYLAKTFVGKEKFCVVLGDNIIFDDLSSHFNNFLKTPFGTSHVFLKSVDSPHNFGVAQFEGDSIVNILEKPSNPPSNFVVIILFFYFFIFIVFF